MYISITFTYGAGSIEFRLISLHIRFDHAALKLNSNHKTKRQNSFTFEQPTLHKSKMSKKSAEQMSRSEITNEKIFRTFSYEKFNNIPRPKIYISIIYTYGAGFIQFKSFLCTHILIMLTKKLTVATKQDEIRLSRTTCIWRVRKPITKLNHTTITNKQLFHTLLCENWKIAEIDFYFNHLHMWVRIYRIYDNSLCRHFDYSAVKMSLYQETRCKDSLSYENYALGRMKISKKLIFRHINASYNNWKYSFFFNNQFWKIKQF